MKKSGAYFDNQGELHIPADVPRAEDLDVALNPRQWYLWILLSAENKRPNYSSCLKNLGSRTTNYRDRKKLMAAGFF